MIKRVYIIALFSLLMISACENLIEGPEDEKENNGSNGIRATFSSIQKEVFTPTCATSGCHGGSQNPNLSVGQAYDNLVNKASSQNSSLMRVKPGESSNSYLIKKLNGDGTSVMPPSGKLSQKAIDSIAAWIDQGALNN